MPLNLTKINCITLKIRSKAEFMSKSQNIWQQIITVVNNSNANDMRVTQDLNSFGEIA
jgi:L-rhamnose mutarotase